MTPESEMESILRRYADADYQTALDRAIADVERREADAARTIEEARPLVYVTRDGVN